MFQFHWDIFLYSTYSVRKQSRKLTFNLYQPYERKTLMKIEKKIVKHILRPPILCSLSINFTVVIFPCFNYLIRYEILLMFEIHMNVNFLSIEYSIRRNETIKWPTESE